MATKSFSKWSKWLRISLVLTLILIVVLPHGEWHNPDRDEWTYAFVWQDELLSLFLIPLYLSTILSLIPFKGILAQVFRYLQVFVSAIYGIGLPAKFSKLSSNIT